MTATTLLQEQYEATIRENEIIRTAARDLIVAVDEIKEPFGRAAEHKQTIRRAKDRAAALLKMLDER